MGTSLHLVVNMALIVTKRRGGDKANLGDLFDPVFGLV
jgi:hypothetical protein